MLKFAYTKIVFEEIPDEIALGISISGCRLHCAGCHSQELWEDIGQVLDIDSISCLIDNHVGISCILFLGGEHDIKAILSLCKYIKHAYPDLKTAWYCGLDQINDQRILDWLDYVKIGHYDIQLGPLSSKTTNQRIYKVKNDKLEDITNEFWKEKI